MSTSWTATNDADLLRGVLPGYPPGPAVQRAVLDAAHPMLHNQEYTLINRLYLSIGLARPDHHTPLPRE